VSTPEKNAPIWARPAPGERKPRFTREQIAEAAVQIADEEGFDAVSMRRVAAKLGAGTMTLYHYVANKDELVALMSNAIMAELVIPEDELADNWRDALAQVARRTYDIFHSHGWSFDQMGEGEGTVGGPAGMQHFDQSLRAVAFTGVAPDIQLEIATFLDDWVFGYVKREVASEIDINEAVPHVAWEYLMDQLATGHYPHIVALVGEGDREEVFGRFVAAYQASERFERGLEMILDGIEARIKREGGRT
jgi:AcrR family transcriptional regulator